VGSGRLRMKFASIVKPVRRRRIATIGRTPHLVAAVTSPLELLRPNLGKFSCNEHRADDRRESARAVGGRAIARVRVAPPPEFRLLGVQLFAYGSFSPKTLRVGTLARLAVSFPNRERIGP
jgi:hypothetical protein